MLIEISSSVIISSIITLIFYEKIKKKLIEKSPYDASQIKNLLSDHVKNEIRMLENRIETAFSALELDIKSKK